MDRLERRTGNQAMSQIRMHLIIAALYGAMAVITFGHAAAANQRQQKIEHTQCLYETGKRGNCIELDNAGLAGLFGAVLWPLYWSWEFWS